MSDVTLHLGDCLDILPTLADNSIDAIVTDPPYGLSFMGKDWDHGVPGVHFWQEALRVAKPGAHLLAFGGTRTFHRLAVAIEDAGWEIRDTIMWVYGSGFPKSHNLGGEWQGWGTALKPAWEPVIVARKPLAGTVAANVQEWGTGAINVDGCRIKADSLTGQRPYNIISPWEQEKNLCDSCAALAAKSRKHTAPAKKASTAISNAVLTSSERVGSNLADIGKENTGCCDGQYREEPGTGQIGAFSLSIDGFGKMPTGQSQPDTRYTTSTGTDSTTGSKTCGACGNPIISRPTNANTPQTKNEKPNTQNGQGSVAPPGRWPSNLIHDGSEDVVRLFPVTTSGKMGPQHTRTTDGSPNGIYGKFDVNHPLTETYGDTGSAARFFYCAKASKADRDEGCEGMPLGEPPASARSKPAEGRKNALGNPRSNHHPTVKPTDLMRYLCRLVTPPGGVVLDPFMGSGSTGKAAILEGFRFVGIEMNADYLEIARARIEHAQSKALPLLMELTETTP